MSYIEWLRRQIGPRKTILIYSTVVVQDPAGRVLMQRRSDFEWWGLPGGILEYGEDILSCARRELHEETGLRIDAARLIGLYNHPRYDVVYPNGDAIQQFTVCFAGQSGGRTLHPDGVETLALEFMTPRRLSSVIVPPWYRAMLADVFQDREAAFEPELRGWTQSDPKAPWDKLWRQPNSIMPAAVAVVRRADGRIYWPRDAGGQRGLPWRPMALGETAATTAVRAAAIPGCEATRLLGIISQPGGVAAGCDQTDHSGHTGHIVAGAFLISTTADNPSPTSADDWVRPEALARSGLPQQAVLLRGVGRALDGGVFVDGQYQEDVRV